MGFGSLGIFSSGGGSGGGGSQIATYANVGSFPATPNAGIILTEALDTFDFYAFDSGMNAYVLVAGPGVALSVVDTDSIDLTLSANILMADLKIGSSAIIDDYMGISLGIATGVTATQGLFAYLNVPNNLASGTSNGFLSFTDWNTFNNNLGASTQIHTIFPLIGGTFLPSNGGITFEIAPASGSTAGYVTTSAQTFGGPKTFPDVVTFGSSGVNFNDVLTSRVNIAAAPVTTSYDLLLPSTTGITNSFLNLVTPAGAMQFKALEAADVLADPNSFLGNNTGSTGPALSLTIAQAKSMLGISGSNFGDVTIGAFLNAESAVGATITIGQTLSFTYANNNSPGMVSNQTQSFIGNKQFQDIISLFQGAGFIDQGGGPGTAFIQGPATIPVSYTLNLPTSIGSTNSLLNNDGLGNLSWSANGTIGGDFLSISAANGTATASTRFVGVTTTNADRSVSIDFVSGVTGAIITVQKLDSGLGQVLVGATQGINGASIMILSGQWTKQSFIATGSGFYA